jgi:2-dehydro-3-deoxyphosphogluconate aldolase / (4S)-4-hydroxy-2-oxoglutarate aldolase
LTDETAFSGHADRQRPAHRRRLPAADHRRHVNDPTLERIRQARIVPVVRTDDAHQAAALVDRIVEAGLHVVELTTTISDWDDLVGNLRAELAGVCVGVGTITSQELAARAVAAGAEFCVTPYPVPSARAVAEHAGVPLLEGGLSPAEVLGAAERGVAKLFPAHVAGVRYLRSLLAVAPTARIMPTGGIPLAEAADWLAAGAFAVGVGSDLTQGDVRSRVEEALQR